MFIRSFSKSKSFLQLKKLVKARHGCSVRSGELAGTVPTLDTTQESSGHVVVEETCGTIRCDDGNEEPVIYLE